MDDLSAARLRQLLNDNELDEALRVASRSLNNEPEDPLALFAAGQALMRAGRKGLAFNLFARCLDLDAPRKEVYNALGFCLSEEHQVAAAEQMFLKSLECDPNYALAMNNLCSMHAYTADPANCLKWGKKAVEASKDKAWNDPLYNMSLAHLMMGNWAQGWDWYEHGLGRNTARMPRVAYDDNGGPEDWDGMPGKSIVVYGEQGIGDEIMFASVLPDAIRDCAKVTIDTDKRLEGLFRRSFPKAVVHGTRWAADTDWFTREKFDARMAVGSFGKFYRRSAEAFPGTPFLVPDPQRVVMWKALLNHLAPGKMKVGIAWTGGIPENFTKRRSVTLESLLPILQTPNVEWVSLQYKNPRKEIDELKARHGITVHHWPQATETTDRERSDYDDTAALIASLDMIVTVCCSVVHLAGGLGVPAWVMTPKRPMWRYGLTGDRMAWYGSHRLFRQPIDDDWTSVIGSIASELRACAPSSFISRGPSLMTATG